MSFDFTYSFHYTNHIFKFHESMMTTWHGNFFPFVRGIHHSSLKCLITMIIEAQLFILCPAQDLFDMLSCQPGSSFHQCLWPRMVRDYFHRQILSLQLMISHEHFLLDLGYNDWIRSQFCMLCMTQLPWHVWNYKLIWTLYFLLEWHISLWILDYGLMSL